MTTRLIIRILDPYGKLLGWTEHHATAKGDGCLRANGPVTIPIDEDGLAFEASIHWPDIHVETLIDMPPRIIVKTGTTVTLFENGKMILTLGETPKRPLPPVTIKQSLRIGVPVGHLGARTA